MNIFEKLKNIRPFKCEISNSVTYDSETEKSKQNPNYKKTYTKERKILGVPWFLHTFEEIITIRPHEEKKPGIGFTSESQKENA